MTQKWVTIQSIWTWWLKVSHQKWVTIWQLNWIMLTFGHSFWTALVISICKSNNYSKISGEIFSLFGWCLDFSSSNVLFEQPFIFSLQNYDFWIPRIKYHIWCNFQLNWTMFNFSSSDVVFEQPFIFRLWNYDFWIPRIISDICANF